MTDPWKVEELIHNTMERIRAHKAVRRHLGGAQNIESDSDLSVVGMQNLMSITAPVVSSRRRVAANFSVLDRLATDSAVTPITIQRGVMDAPVVSVILCCAFP